MMLFMPRPPTPIHLSDSERAQLQNWLRQSKTEARFADRARIILWAEEGLSNKQIAERLDTRRARISKWRTRFDQERLAGLADDFRPGIAPKYGAHTRQRILRQLDEPLPQGYSSWSGPLLAKALGDVSVHQIWRELRALGISLERRHSWCVSTDPEFAQKAADIVGLYLNPPENALVVAVDEKPCIQALERDQGWIRLPNGKSLSGHAHEYKRHGTSTLFAALDVISGEVKAGHYKRRRRREFLNFMNELVHGRENQQIHVILDNLNTHKPKNDRWLAQHPNVHFHYTPTHGSWLNQVEVWFSILSRQALRGANFHSVQELREKIDAFIEVYNQTAAPFEWTKVKVSSKKLEHKYSNLCN
jgi:transposase